jgi:hypothetical protein
MNRIHGVMPANGLPFPLPFPLDGPLMMSAWSGIYGFFLWAI